MKKLNYLLLLCLVIFFAHCKKDETKTQEEILHEKEQLLIGDWFLHNGTTIRESDEDGDGIYSSITIIYKDSMKIDYEDYYDSTLYTEELIFNSNNTFIQETKKVKRYNDPNYPHPNLRGIHTYYNEGFWYIVGETETLDFENKFKVLLEIELSLCFSPIDTYNFSTPNYFKDKKIIKITNQSFNTLVEYENIILREKYTEQQEFRKK